MSIGDINSSARGTGARFNTGKPAVELLPISELARYFHYCDDGGTSGPPDPIVHCLYKLGEFQEGGGIEPLLDILHILGDADVIVESAHVFGYGAGKYAAHNWIKGMPWSVPIACAVRHLLAMRRGELIDPESGREHRGHVACNVWMLVLYVRIYPQGDDRPPRELFSGSVPGAPPLPAPVIETIEPLPMIERRRSPRPDDVDLMLEAAKALNDFGVKLQGSDAAPNAATYKTWTPEACFALKSKLRAVASGE